MLIRLRVKGWQLDFEMPESLTGSEGSKSGVYWLGQKGVVVEGEFDCDGSYGIRALGTDCRKILRDYI